MLETNELERWMKISEFVGETNHAIKEVNNELIEIKDNIIKLDMKMDKVNERLTNMQLKVASIGSISGLLVTLVTLVITGAL